MNKGQEVKKSLKHGYIFLIITLLIPFSIALGFELYTTGHLKVSDEDDTHIPVSYPTEEPEEEPEGIKKPTLEIKNLEDGFTTKETSVVLVASTEVGNSAWINGNEITVSGDGNFEYKIELVEGENKIDVKVKNEQGLEASATIHVNREVEKKPDPEPVNPPTQQPVPSPQPNPVPTPSPTPTPTPAPSPVSGLKLQCSITNTAPFPGESVSVNCTVRDQNNNPVSGAFGYVTMSWKSGSSVHTLSQSNGSGSMTVNFTVPAGNSGGNSGNVQVSKDGLNVSSNFNLNVQ